MPNIVAGVAVVGRLKEVTKVLMHTYVSDASTTTYVTQWQVCQRQQNNAIPAQWFAHDLTLRYLS